MNKAAWRKHIRSLHQGKEARDAQSAALCRHILASKIYQNARVVGGYMPLPKEADVLPVLIDALRQGKTLVLPLCENAPQMTLRRVSSLEELIPGAYGILEPRETAEIIPVEQLDLLLVPLEGIDADGFRLGKGGGYYDCILKDADVYTIGCALSWQLVKQLPHDAWDKPLKAFADMAGLHKFSV